MIVTQRWVRKKRWCLLILSFLMLIVMLFCIFLNDFVIAGRFHYPFSEKCVLSTATNLLNDQCNNFTKGLAYGVLCEALCLSKKIAIETCIHHGNTYVFMAKHDGNSIIIKKKKPRDVRYLYNYFTDVLAPLRRLSVGFQQDLHDPVKAVRRVQQFNCTMEKFKDLLNNSLGNISTEQTILTNYKKLIESIVEKDDNFIYQNIPLENFNKTNACIYTDMMNSLTTGMDLRFKDIKVNTI
ncbi:uncharacterized protein LOC136091307 [Hydra vulgaris]|uniref:Uncharacterized protein LOC136091307 n=1 Tax=Hydra vulgaris TaxID=6087 RepID=A0ABM4DJT7_HYDVU